MKTITKPDLKAPRAKLESGYCPINVGLWRKFMKRTGIKCTYREFADTIKTGNEIISETIVNERDGFRLLNNIGCLAIISIIPSKQLRNPDYGTLAKDGIQCKHMNLETDRNLACILYLSYMVKDEFLNRKLWTFTAVRPLKRKASKSFRMNHTMYRRVQGFEKINQILKAEKRFAKQLEEEQDFLKTYNDLEIYAESD